MSKYNDFPANGMTIRVRVDDVEHVIVDPRASANANGGPEWVMRYGNPDSIRYTVASLLASYDYLLSDNLTTAEAIRRLRIMRKYRAAATKRAQADSALTEKLNDRE